MLEKWDWIGHVHLFVMNFVAHLSFSKFSFIFSCPKNADYSIKVVFFYLEKTQTILGLRVVGFLSKIW